LAFSTITSEMIQYIAIVTMYTVSKKLDPFSFEHNFGKYCPILIIRSLLQTAINYDQV